MPCIETNRQRAVLCFALLPPLCGILFLSLLLTKLTLEANAQVRAIQEFEKVASVLALYFSFICMLDIVLVIAVLGTLGNGLRYLYLEVNNKK